MIDTIAYYYRFWYRRLLMSWDEKRCYRCLTTVGCKSKYSSDYNYLRKLDDSKTYMCEDCEFISMVN